MQISDSLEVGIGLSFIFFVASLVLASIHELIETVLKARGRNLFNGVVELLDDPHIAESGAAAARALYAHPMIRGLMRGDLTQAGAGGKLPSYLPRQSVSAALVDQALRGKLSTLATPATLPASLPQVAQLRMAAEGIENAQLRKGLIHAIDTADGDIAAVRTNLEYWFDSAMDRVSGWYKRRSQRIIFALGLTTALMLNVNTLSIAASLSMSGSLRQALVTVAEQRERACIADRSCNDSSLGASAMTELQRSTVPVGWTDAATAAVLLPTQGGNAVSAVFGWVQVVAGYLLTAFAVTLGAPFWFDVLNRLMVIRATVKPAEKSQPEAPQDPQPKKADTLSVNVVEHASPPPPPATSPGREVIDADIHNIEPSGAERLFEDDEGGGVTGVRADQGASA